MILRAHGALLDPEGHRYTDVSHLVGTSSVVTASASLEAFLPPVADQGHLGQCTGEERAGSDYTSLGAQGTPVGRLSASWSYRGGRAIDRQRDSAGHLPKLVDEGSAPNQVLRFAQEFGHLPYDADPAEPEHVNDEPDLLGAERSSLCELVGAYAIYADDPVPDYERANASGRTVGFTVEVTAAWDAYRGGILTEAAQTGASRGRHRVFGWGFERRPDGSWVGKGRCSWGTDYGDLGNFYFDGTFLRRTRNLIVANVRRA